MERLTPKQARSTKRGAFALALYGFMKDLGYSEEYLAHLCGTQQQKVSLWLNPKSPVKPQASDIALFPRELAERVLGWLASDHGLVVAPSESVVPTSGHLAMVESTVKESTEAVAALVSTVASPKCPEKRRTAIREAEEGIRQMQAMVAALKREEMAHVAAVGGARGVA
jgi:hypothetical protein